MYYSIMWNGTYLRLGNDTIIQVVRNIYIVKEANPPLLPTLIPAFAMEMVWRIRETRMSRDQLTTIA